MTGVYGVVANSVVERRREFGVRLALGATPLQTLKTAAAAGITLTLVGTIGGLLLALFAIRLMRPFVFGVTVNDPLTLGVAATLVVLTGSAAALVPALRTLRLNVSSILSTKG
jgi:ABC-type antimicrobial peptide transport system permease subunit